MAERQALRYQVLDSSGVPIAGANIQVAQLDTTTDITQTMYAGLTGATTIANPLVSDASGWVQAYFDGTDAVALKRVTVIPTKTGFTFTTRNVQLGSDYGVLDDGVAPIKATTVDATDRFNMARGSAGDPTSLQVGDMWYNTTTNSLQWEDNTGTQTVSSTTGDITGVTAGDGLTGGGVSGDVTLDVGDGNAIVASADAVDVSVNAASSAAASLAGDDKILISDTDDSNTTKSATISQIDPTLLNGGNNKVYYTDSSGDVTELALGAADTVLTSSGATSAPTWAAAAGGSEITLNSSAAIALGKFVVLETAGTVKEVSSTTTLSTSFGSKVTSGGPTSVNEKQHPSVIWDSTRGVFWCSVANTSGVIQIYIMEVTSAGVVTLTSVSTISGTGTGTYGLQSMTHDTTNDKLVVMYEATTGYFDVQSGTLSGTGSSSTVSAWSGAVNVSSSWYRWVGVPVSSVYVAATDRSYFFFTNFNQYAAAFVINTSGASPVIANSGGYIESNTNNQYYGYDCALAANGQIAVVGAGNGGYAGMTAYNITPSASGWTRQDATSTGTQIMAGIAGIGTTQGVAVVYDASQTKMVAYQVGNQAQTEVATFVIPTTGDMTNVSTTLALDSANTFTYVQRVRPPLGYDTTNNVVVAGYKTTAAGSSVVFERIDTSGTNPVKAGSPVTSTLNEANWSQFGGVAYSPTYDWVCWSGTWGATSGGFSVSTASVSTNNTAQIGVAQNAATGAGQAVTVKTLGGLDETQTGMTVGDIYIDKDGAPTATSTGLNVQVGRAIAANKLLITETGSGTV